MNRIAVIRADASQEIGGGHVFRCLTLADSMADVGWRCIFACRRGTCEAVPMLGRSRHEVFEVDALEEAAQLRQFHPARIDLLIIDHYGLDARFEAACRSWTRRIMVLDDGPGRCHDCDILLDQNLGAQSDAYRGFIPANSLLLTGPSYALLRPQFLGARRKALERRSAGGPARRLLISLGAADPSNIASRVIAASAALPLEIDVVLGSASAQEKAVLALASSHDLPVRVHVDVDDMAALMTAADFAVGAGGSTSWERCCLGLPSLIIVLAENQRQIAASLGQAGAALNLGMVASLTSQHLTAALKMLHFDQNLRSAMAAKAATICDGDGTKRVMEILENG